MKFAGPAQTYDAGRSSTAANGAGRARCLVVYLTFSVLVVYARSLQTQYRVSAPLSFCDDVHRSSSQEKYAKTELHIKTIWNIKPASTKKTYGTAVP